MKGSEIIELILDLIDTAVLFGKLPGLQMPGYTDMQRKIPDVRVSHEGQDKDAWSRKLRFSFQHLLSQSLLIFSCLVYLRKFLCIVRRFCCICLLLYIGRFCLRLFGFLCSFHSLSTKYWRVTMA